MARTPARLALIETLRATDTSWRVDTVVAMARAAADDIERLCEMLEEAEEAHRIDMKGAEHNRFYDQRDG